MIRAGHKGVLIQVPKELHLELKRIAKSSGKSMQVVGLYAIERLVKKYREREAGTQKPVKARKDKK